MDKMLWYKKPTEDYMEGLPLGNGRLAAMALGLPGCFRLALNHEWLWRGVNRGRDIDDVHEHLGEVRRLLLDGKFAEGTTLANDYFGGGGGMTGKRNRVDPYLPAGDVYVRMETGEVRGYTRALDLNTGLSATEFDCDCCHVVQCAFVSAADGVAVVRIESGRACALEVELTRAEEEGCTLAYEGRTLPGADGEETTMRGAFKGGISFAVALRAVSDGRMTRTERGMRIEGARCTVLMVQIGTDAKGISPEDEMTFPERHDFDWLFARHAAAFRELLGTAELDVPLPDSDKPTDERVSDFRAGNDPQIPLLYFEYGRYLMASGSSGELPLNLQGKWNDLLTPPWESDYHMDINHEMC